MTMTSLQLMYSIWVLLYSLKACSRSETQIQSLDFVINRLFMKLFNTSDISRVKQCQDQFNFTLHNVALERRRTKFMCKFSQSSRGCSISLSCLHWHCIDILHFFFTVWILLLLVLFFATFCWMKIFRKAKTVQTLSFVTVNSALIYIYIYIIVNMLIVIEIHNYLNICQKILSRFKPPFHTFMILICFSVVGFFLISVNFDWMIHVFR